MFLDLNQVNNLLNCKNCNERLDEPRLLPCGDNICSACAQSIKLNGKQYDCLVCSNKHKMPKSGLHLNKVLVQMLSFKSIDISRGKAFNSLQVTLHDLFIKSNILKHRLGHRDDYVKEHCNEIRNKVQLATEEAILQINKFNERLIDKVDEYENDLIQLNTYKNELMKNFQKLIDEIDLFNIKTNEYLKEYNLNDDDLIKLNSNAIILRVKAETEIYSLNDAILDDRIMSFEPNKEVINQMILGELKITKVANLKSSILPVFENINDLMTLCEFPIDQKWNLIYRASQDGFEGSNFHAKCDNKPNTFIIIKSENGNVFGGYTEQSWSGDVVYKADPKSFIFSLINLDNKPLKIKWSRKKGIYCYNKIGPVFGGGPFIGKVHDIRIEDQSNTNTDSYSNLGHSYTHPDYIEGSNKAKSFLAGSYNFKVSDIEVFTNN
jgi:hypothetical protein